MHIVGERVRWEICLSSFTDAALARCMRFLVEHRIRLHDAYVTGSSDHGNRNRSVILLIDMEPELQEKLVEKVKPYEMIYRSPTYFDNGSLRPIFASPKDQLAGIETPGKKRFDARNGHEE